MAGFKLDDNGDIDVDSNGKMLRLITYQELVKQRLQIKLKTYKGEWFLDTSFGIPYRDTGDGRAIIGKGFTQKDIDAVYIAAINEDPDVLSIEYFKSIKDNISRGYSVSFEVKSRNGNLPLNNPSSYAWEDDSYEYVANNITPLYDIGQWALDIHPIVHEDMPEALQPPYEWLPT